MEREENTHALPLANVELLPLAKVRLGSLVAAGSPRCSGENPGHARVLADSEDQLPPIVVHRPTMRVIDGMHRLRAAELRGEEEIEVRFFDGDEASSFVLAVRANVTHGLPLSLADRKAAAKRIMELYPDWSDRMIASVTGLAAKTVAARRKCPTGEKQLDTRIGRDGRARPVDSTGRREIAAQLIADNPDASLREVASRAGLSPETVRDVRARLGPARRPVSALQHKDSATGGPARQRSLGMEQRSNGAGHAGQTGTSALQVLLADPAFRSTESGRSLLRMLSAPRVFEQRGKQFIDSVPAHCMDRFAEAVQTCVQTWEGFAEDVERRRQALLEAESSGLARLRHTGGRHHDSTARARQARASPG